jgi:pimeloyl-ACP methyl ester carboxylesterase
MRTPTLFLVGGASHANELDDASGVARALPDACVVILPGQQHIAMHTAPDLFVREVVQFLS